jgi:hypothetical protein
MDQLTHDCILRAMKPGAGYAVHMLSEKLGETTATVRPLVLELLAAGKLSTFMRGKNTCYILAGTEHLRRHQTVVSKPTAEPDPSMVALPRTFCRLSGEMTGYFAEINQRAALAMMVRPR